MPTDADFLAAMAATPFDDLPRLQYADWLDDRGDARAEWVRLEVAVCPHFRDVREWKRFVELSDTLPPEWLAAAGWYRWPLLVAQLGRRRDDKHLSNLREAIPGPKEHISYDSGEYYEMAKSMGYWLKFIGVPGPDILTDVFLISENAKEHKSYPGSLPLNLTFENNRLDAEALLGREELLGTTRDLPTWQSWDCGIHISYCVPNLLGRRNPIRQVSLSLKREVVTPVYP